MGVAVGFQQTAFSDAAVFALIIALLPGVRRRTLLGYGLGFVAVAACWLTPTLIVAGIPAVAFALVGFYQPEFRQPIFADLRAGARRRVRILSRSNANFNDQARDLQRRRHSIRPCPTGRHSVQRGLAGPGVGRVGQRHSLSSILRRGCPTAPSQDFATSPSVGRRRMDSALAGTARRVKPATFGDFVAVG